MKVRKRDGSLEDFNPEKIVESIFRSAQTVGGKDRDTAKRLGKEAVANIQMQFKADVLSTEDIGNIVEKVLIERGHARTAKAYILYRKHQEELKKIRSTSLEVERIVDSYIGHLDWRVRENANIDFSLSGLEQHISTTVIANYTLSKLYPMEVADAHSNGDIHIHDLGRGICGYCAGWSLQQLLAEGFNGVPNRIGSKPPKHMTTALLQMVNFMGTLSNEWAGAMAFNSIDTLLAPFVWADSMDYGDVKQALQELVFNLNVTSRFGGQCPFTNVTLDLNVPKDLADKPAIVGKKVLDRTYGEFTEEAEIVNRAFIEVLSEGDMNGRPFTFPIPTYSITKDFEWDSPLSDTLFEATAKYGQPYFQNFVNSDLNPSDVRSMCCRLRLDMRELRNKMSGGLFGAGDSTGSMGVVTINMGRLGYLAENEDEFFERLFQIMELAKRSLEIKREIVEKNISNGLLPFTKRYLGNLNNHFSTIGLVGINEAMVNLIEQSIITDEGKKLAVKTLKAMRQRLVEFQEETGHLYNLEATPAEGTSYRLALIDRRKYPDIKTAGERVPYYTNSSQLPVNAGLDLVEALDHQEDLQTLYSGGTVFHTWLGEKIQGQGAKLLLKKMTANSRLPYFTLTPTFSICPDHGYMPGEHKSCLQCGKQTEIYSRVVGYLRPVAIWSDGKKEEFRQRSYFG